MASGRSCLRGIDLDRSDRCRAEVLVVDVELDPSAGTLGRFNRSWGLLVALAPVAAVLSAEGGVTLRQSFSQLVPRGYKSIYEPGAAYLNIIPGCGGGLDVFEDCEAEFVLFAFSCPNTTDPRRLG